MLREHLNKIVIVALLAVIVGTPILLRRDSQAPSSTADSPRLVIYTPHNDQTREEFAHAFNNWRAQQGQSPVTFDWRTMGGTSDLRKTILSQFKAAAEAGQEDQGIGADLFFGGGEYEHNKLVQGVTVTRQGETRHIPASVPAQISEGLLKDAFPQPTIGGERLYHPELRWVGVALSSFGIIYNRDVLDMLSLSEPRTWAHLADPRYRGWLILADPAHSGSITAAYHIILQRHGWNRGWRVLRQIFANTRYFTSAASAVPVDVAQGEAAAGMAIDFYARYQAGAVADGRLGYVDPPYMTATTADPISVLRGAPQPALAHQFVAWLLSPQAQNLWQKRLDTPAGPRRFELRRLPVRRDLYTPQHKQHWADPEVTPFETARDIPDAVPDFYLLVAPIAHAMALDVHDDLAAAWNALQHTPRNHPARSKMEDLFYWMPAELTLDWPADLEATWPDALEDPAHPQHTEAANVLADFASHLFNRYFSREAGDRLVWDRIRWASEFRRRYRQVVELAPE